MLSTKAEREHRAWAAAKEIKMGHMKDKAIEAQGPEEGDRVGTYVQGLDSYQRLVTCCQQQWTPRDFAEHNRGHGA